MSGDKDKGDGETPKMGRVFIFPGAEGCITPPIAMSCASIAICGAIVRVANRMGKRNEKGGDAEAVASLATAYDDLVVGTRQTVEGSGCK